MGLDLARRPARCMLLNTATAESFECLANPSQVTEKVAVNWNRVAVPGLSHQLLQYGSTGNRQFGLEFYLNKFFALERSSDPDILAFRAFLGALTVPPGRTHGVLGTAPPRALVVWPGVISIEGVLTDLEFRYETFATDASLLVYTASVTVEEILDVRVTSEQRRGGL